MKILIVDDNMDDRQVLRYTIEAHGHQVIAAGDGEEGLRMAALHMPDLIISDVFMPGMDGFQFLRNLKTIAAIPFIFYSAVYKGGEDEQLASSLGAEAYLVKPKDPLELWEEIALVIGKAGHKPAVRVEPVEENEQYLKRYSQVVAAKLEEKVRELEATLAERELAEEALRESEKRYKQLLDSVTDYIYTVEVREGEPVVTVHSPGCATVTGYSPQDYADDPQLWFSMVHLDDRDAVAEQVAGIRAGVAAWPLEHRIVHRDGSIRWVRNTPVPRYDERRQLITYDGLIADITERRRLERELFEAKRLEIIGHLAGGVAHEVRNPLNAILSISEALFREKEIAANPEYLPYIGHIRAQIGRLCKLMTDLLDLGKPIRPSSITETSLPRLCSDTIALWKAGEGGRRHPVSLILDEPGGRLTVQADEARLQQVLLNLLDNAAQNSPEGSGIVLRVAAPQGERIAVRISDLGKGISGEQMVRLFEPFFTGRREGTGLGLTLVKHFVENMGGEVRIFNNETHPGCIDNEPARGCTAELILNLARGNRETA